MGSRKTGTIRNNVEAPTTLANHGFYGLTLDEEQKHFRDAIWNDEKLIVFCNARAGTGKTTIAAGVSNLLVEYGKYKGIVYIASPTQEQKQGYLAGSIEEKSEPYFEPFYQALKKIRLNMNTVLTSDIMNLKNGTGYVTCMTHTFLRGTNFEEMIVILDEAQNFTVPELQKVLTRIHDNCKVIVIGHSGQIDITQKNKSGFIRYLEHYNGHPYTEVCQLTKNYRGWISNTADDIYNEKENEE